MEDVPNSIKLILVHGLSHRLGIHVEFTLKNLCFCCIESGCTWDFSLTICACIVLNHGKFLFFFGFYELLTSDSCQIISECQACDLEEAIWTNAVNAFCW